MKKRIIAILALLLVCVLLTSCEVASVDEVDNTGMFSGERFMMFGQVLALGLGAVFASLAILWVVVWLFGLIFGKERKKALKATEEPVSESKPEPENVNEEQDDPALIAVISAAVAAYIDGDPKLASQFESGFRVVSFKRSGKTR